MINPLTTEGQIIGAAAQGIGGALFEEFQYDEQGQPLSTSFMDYLLPGAGEVPAVQFFVTEDAPTPDNPLGAKGLGEVGLIAVGAAVAGAIDDALGGEFRVRRIPVHPQDLFELGRWQGELVESFSHGMKQRLVMCAAFLHDYAMLYAEGATHARPPQRLAARSIGG